MIEVEPNRFFPSDPDVRELAISFRIFLTLLTSMGKFGENLQYNVTPDYIHMNFDLQGGATLSLSISKITNDTWARVKRNEEVTGEVPNLSEINVDSEEQTLYLKSTNGLFTIDKLGNIQEISTVPSTATSAKPAREIAVQAIEAHTATKTQLPDDIETAPRDEEETSPVLTLPQLEDETSDSTTEVVVTMQSEPINKETISNSNPHILEIIGQIAESGIAEKPAQKGTWHLPERKDIHLGTK